MVVVLQLGDRETHLEVKHLPRVGDRITALISSEEGNAAVPVTVKVTEVSHLVDFRPTPAEAYGITIWTESV